MHNQEFSNFYEKILLNEWDISPHNQYYQFLDSYKKIINLENADFCKEDFVLRDQDDVYEIGMLNELLFLKNLEINDNKKEILFSEGRELLSIYPFLGVLNQLLIDYCLKVEDFENYSFYSQLLIKNFSGIDSYKINYASFYFNNEEYLKSAEILPTINSGFLRMYMIIFCKKDSRNLYLFFYSIINLFVSAILLRIDFNFYLVYLFLVILLGGMITKRFPYSLVKKCFIRSILNMMKIFVISLLIISVMGIFEFHTDYSNFINNYLESK